MRGVIYIDNREDPKTGAGAIFVPVGILMGLGIGALLGHITAGLFVGTAIGFLLFALTSLPHHDKILGKSKTPLV